MKETTKRRIRQKIREKSSVVAAGELVQSINQEIERYPELTPRQKDFAFRYAMEQRTYQQWANFYGVTYATIQRMMDNPRVRKLIADIQFDVRKFRAGMAVFLQRESLEQMLRIFRKPETDDNLETKRKAAHDVLEFFSQDEGGSKGKGKSGMNIAIFNTGPGDTERNVTPTGDDQQSMTLDEIESQLLRVKKLKNLKEQVEKHGEGGNEG